MSVLEFQFPERDTPQHSQRVQLEGSEYVFTFTYNFRGETWYVSIDTIDGERVVSDKRIGCRVDILKGVSSSKAPPGVLSCFNLDSSDERPKLNDLGVSHVLWYITSDDEALQ